MNAPDPTQVTAEVADVLDQLDDLRAQSDDDDGPTGLAVSTLEAQADLFERAHAVLTDALEHLDRV